MAYKPVIDANKKEEKTKTDYGSNENRDNVLSLSNDTDTKDQYCKKWLFNFFQKFSSLKLLVEPDFLVFGMSRAILEVCVNLMFVFFPLFIAKIPGVDEEAASWLRFCFIVFTPFGGLLIGIIVDKKLMEVDALTTLTNCSAGVMVFLFPFMPKLTTLVLTICASGLFMGSQALTNTLILIKFYDKTVLASALTMTGNFKAIGGGVAPMLFTYMVDNGIDGTFVWVIGGIAFISAGLLTTMAAYLNKQKHKKQDIIPTRSLRQLAAAPLGGGEEMPTSCNYHWTPTGPANPSGGPYRSHRAGNPATNHKFNRDT